jgi:two-component system LytT family response regulator
MINRLRPDLIFLDIQMPGKDGFEVVQQLDTVPYIIFCTAYDHFALKAFETNSIDYILKPITPERMAVALKKVQHL